MDIVASLYQRDILYEPIEAAAKELFIPFAVGGGCVTLKVCPDYSILVRDKVVVNARCSTIRL